MIKEFKLPCTFDLFGTNWQVLEDNDYCENKGIYGECSHTEKRIVIATRSHGKDRPQSGIEHTLLHEITHAILFNLKEEDLNDNEKFVNTFSACLHQILTTMK